MNEYNEEGVPTPGVDRDVQDEHGHFSVFTEHSSIPTAAQLSVALLLLLAVFGISYVPGLTRDPGAPLSPTEERIRARIDDERSVAKPPEVVPPDITASAAYVWDSARERALYSKNPDTRLPLASLTKLMTALVAREVLQGGTVPITLAAIAQEGEAGFVDGDQFSERDLSDFALISSSNDAAYALAAAAGRALTADARTPEERFVEAMNIRARELGLTNTYFNNPTGLDESGKESGAYGSARDVAFLMEYLVERREEVVETTVRQSAALIDASGYARTAQNTNEAIADIEGLIASKTGYTDLAGGNLVVAFDAGLGRPIIITVLGSTREGRFDDIITLAEYAREAIIRESSTP
jgi:serine-type D-Ala-D-Ala carboxypeptidase (penicillin-binding protein 5/6)